MPYAIVTVLVLAFLAAAPAQAQVQVHVGIHLPAPPQLVVVPGVAAVRYAPAAPINVFAYGGQYWVFDQGNWFASAAYAGPWVAVAPQFVPRPLLLVPVRYYKAPPRHWQPWPHQRPPRWDDDWGRDWADKRQWKRDRDDDKHRGKGRDDDDRGRGKGRGRDDDRRR